MKPRVELGLRANVRQFALLVGLNALVGALVGLERSVLPQVGKHDFHVRATLAVLAFVIAFGAAKALTNLTAGVLAERLGRKRLLVLGWLAAFPVPLMIGLAPSWWWVVAANALLGVNQGLAWSMTVVMKVDLAGSRRRGLALGLNEAAGYVGVAATAFASGVLAASFAPRTIVWAGAAVIAVTGLLLTLVFVRDTGEHARLDETPAAPNPRVLRSCSQAGFVNNLNDALVWGLAPLYLAAHGARVAQIGAVAAVYPIVWGVGQLGTGWLSDSAGRKALIAAGMVVQAGALALLVGGSGRFAVSLAAASVLGLGTALVYPTLLAAVSDASGPGRRARAICRYRFWRDSGFVAGALVAGLAADAASPAVAILIVAALTAVSGLAVAATPWQSPPTERRNDACHRLSLRTPA